MKKITLFLKEYFPAILVSAVTTVAVRLLLGL